MKYTWEYNDNEEYWTKDVFDSVEDCILDAKENYDIKPSETIAIGELFYWEPYVDAYDLLERIEFNAWDECGEASEDWNTYDYKRDKEKVEQLSEKLTEIVRQWLKENSTYPTFSIINNVRVVEIE